MSDEFQNAGGFLTKLLKIREFQNRSQLGARKRRFKQDSGAEKGTMTEEQMTFGPPNHAVHY